tara:strand:+ start:6110 stop:6943 length:834 start_codon:yes stop_codon:yes gene_type:complete
MAYVGNKPDVNYTSFQKQDLTGATGGTLTLSTPVTNANEIQLFINHVRQESGTSYTASGTTVTLQGYTVSASDDIYVIYHQAFQTTQPPDGSVSSAKLDTNIAVAGTLGVTGASTFSGGIANTGTISAGTLAPAVAMASGAVIQVAYYQANATLSNQSTSATATAYHVALTPRFANSKMIISLNGGQQSYSSGGPWLYKALYRQINSGGWSALYSDIGRAIMVNSYGMAHSSEVFDAPNTTNLLEYKIYINVNDASKIAYLNVSPTQLTLKVMEVKQ